MTQRDSRELLALAPHMRGRMCYIILKGLRDPEHIVRRKQIEVSCDRLLIKMGKMGILIGIKPGVWKLNLEYLRKIAYILPDPVFDKISDPEYVFELKKKRFNKRRGRKITYDQQREAWRKRDQKSKAVKYASREKPIEPEAIRLSTIFFPTEEVMNGSHEATIDPASDTKDKG